LLAKGDAAQLLSTPASAMAVSVRHAGAGRPHEYMNTRYFVLAFALCVISSGGATAAGSAVFVSVPKSSVRLETFVYQPPGDGKFPVVIFNHGSAGGNPKISLPSQPIADYFVQRGFIVVVPMRRGRGQSSGVSPESETKNCDPASWEPGIRLSFDDLSAVFEYIAHIPKAKPSSVILAGASRGGFLSVAYAARGEYRKNIIGAIDFNYVSFAKFGAKTRIPMLWLYGSHDAFYDAESIESYHKVFAAKGGDVSFQLIDGVPQNGHWLPGYPDLWSKSVDPFIASLRANVQ